MTGPRGLLLAAALALGAAAPALGATPAEMLEVRPDDVVILRAGGERLVGEIKTQDERELRIKVRGGIVQTVAMADVEQILPRRTIRQAFDSALKELSGRRDAVGLYGLAVELLKINPGMTEQARGALEAARDIQPGLGEARLMLGQLYLRLGGDFLKKRAPEEADAAVAALPQRAAAHVLRGTVLARQGRPREALAALEKALALKPSADEQVAAAEALAEIGETARAQKIIEAVIAADPENAGAKLAAGEVFLRVGDLVQAESLLSKAADALRNRSEPHLALACALYLKGDLDRAAGELDIALNYGATSDARARALKGLIAMRRGEAAKALEALDGAVSVDPGEARVAAARAALEVSGGKLDEALKFLEPAEKDSDAAKRLRESPDAYFRYFLGHVLLKKGDCPRALAEFERAAELAPRWPDALLSAGAAALAGRNYPAAVANFEKAVKLDPGCAAARAGLGLSYLGQPGRDEEADRELRGALKLDPKCVQAHLGLGYLANKLRRENEAIAAFERAIGLDGANAYAADALTKLRAGRGEEVQYFSFEEPALPAGWAVEQLYGVQVKAGGGRVLMAGKQKRTANRETRFLLRLEGAKFSRLDLDVECAPTGGVAAGLYLNTGTGDIEIAMTETGKLGWRKRDRSGWSAFEETADWPRADGGAVPKVRLGIELVDIERGAFRVYAGGRSVTDKEIVVDTMARAGNVAVGAFCRAQLDDDVSVGLDNACLVVKKPKASEK